jgi:hypothetical protein
MILHLNTTNPFRGNQQQQNHESQQQSQPEAAATPAAAAASTSSDSSSSSSSSSSAPAAPAPAPAPMSAELVAAHHEAETAKAELARLQQLLATQVCVCVRSDEAERGTK